MERQLPRLRAEPKIVGAARQMDRATQNFPDPAGSRERIAASTERMAVNVVRGAANDKCVDANRLRGDGSLVEAAGTQENGGVNAECIGANGERDDYIDKKYERRS